MANKVLVVEDLPKGILDAMSEASRKIRDQWIIGLEKGTYSLSIYGESD